MAPSSHPVMLALMNKKLSPPTRKSSLKPDRAFVPFYSFSTQHPHLRYLERAFHTFFVRIQEGMAPLPLGLGLSRLTAAAAGVMKFPCRRPGLQSLRAAGWLYKSHTTSVALDNCIHRSIASTSRSHRRCYKLPERLYV